MAYAAIIALVAACAALMPFATRTKDQDEPHIPWTWHAIAIAIVLIFIIGPLVYLQHFR